MIIKILNRKYLAFSRFSNIRAWGIAILDIIYYIYWGKTSRHGAIPSWSHLALVKLDQLGDLLMVTPALVAVRAQRPNALITLITGSWNRALASWLLDAGMIDRIVWLDAVGCSKSKNFLAAWLIERKSWISAKKILRTNLPDAFLDLRPRSPNALLLARELNIKWRVGFGLRGLSFTIHREINYDETLPLGQMFIDSLEHLGLGKHVYGGPVLPHQTSSDIFGRLAVEKKKYGLIHSFSRDAGRQVPIALWLEIFRVIKKDYCWIYVGTSKEAADNPEFLELTSKFNIISAVGKTSFQEVALLVQEACSVICVDSMVAHLAIAYKVPALVLMMPHASVRLSFPNECCTSVFVDASSLSAVHIALTDTRFRAL